MSRQCERDASGPVAEDTAARAEPGGVVGPGSPDRFGHRVTSARPP